MYSWLLKRQIPSELKHFSKRYTEGTSAGRDDSFILVCTILICRFHLERSYCTIVRIYTLEDQAIFTVILGQLQVPIYSEHMVVVDTLYLAAVPRDAELLYDTLHLIIDDGTLRVRASQIQIE